MKTESKKQFLERYARESGYEIDYEETYRLQHLLADTSINLRVSNEMKEEIKKIAKRKGIPYQRLIKSFIIDGITKNKESA